jgi:hypothetical protein
MPQNTSEHWLDDILDAYRQLPARTLRFEFVYPLVERIRRERHHTLPPTWKSIVRDTVYVHSSDAPRGRRRNRSKRYFFYRGPNNEWGLYGPYRNGESKMSARNGAAGAAMIASDGAAAAENHSPGVVVPSEIAVPTTTPSGGVPAFISTARKAELRELGYTAEQIYWMKPMEADIIVREKRAPTAVPIAEVVDPPCTAVSSVEPNETRRLRALLRAYGINLTLDETMESIEQNKAYEAELEELNHRHEKERKTLLAKYHR